jgi:hypothetical protein
MILRLLLLCAASALADPMAIYQQALDARKARDAQGFLQLTGQLTQWAPTNPTLHFLHAEALALSGRNAPALGELRWLATHGYHYAFWERDTFEKLPANAETTVLREAITKNGKPAGQIAHLIRLNPADLDAEGIDAMPSGWIIGSMANGNLYRVDRSGATTQLWRETEPGRRLFGVRHDAQRNLVWACSGGPGDGDVQPQLLRISLQPVAVNRTPLPHARSLCNDVAMLPDGLVAVSDSHRGAVWQLGKNGRWRALAEPGTLGYPNGLVYLSNEQRLVVADLRGLWTIDLGNARIAPVAAPEGTFVGGIDGLYTVDGELLAIQNGLRPHRVLRIVLARRASRVERVTTIASNLPELAAMTTAAVGRGEITVLAGSQLVQLVSSDSANDR